MDIISLAPQFGNVFWVIVFFVLALSIIVAIHEFGHYITGRWCGIRADVFSVGFGPSLWSWTDRTGTRWQIAALPLGGYVKFFGDSGPASERASGEFEKMPPELRRQTIHGAPLWARTLTVSAGPAFNFILSIILFATMAVSTGRIADPPTIGKINPLPTQGVELLPGDEIIRINGVDLWESAGLDSQIPYRTLLEYDVRREGRTMTVLGPHPYPPLVSGLSPLSAAYEAGIKKGDVIVGVNDRPVATFSEVKEFVESSSGAVLKLKVWRNGDTLDFELEPRRRDEQVAEGGFETNWRIGITAGLAFELARESVPIGESLVYAVERTWLIVSGSISGIWHIITGVISSCNISGPIGIAKVSGAMASQGASSFVLFIAVLSTAVGLLNLFPIPVLDGGHLVFYAYELVAGRRPSDKTVGILTTMGFGLLFGIMAFAIFNDIFCT